MRKINASLNNMMIPITQNYYASSFSKTLKNSIKFAVRTLKDVSLKQLIGRIGSMNEYFLHLQLYCHIIYLSYFLYKTTLLSSTSSLCGEVIRSDYIRFYDCLFSNFQNRTGL